MSVHVIIDKQSIRVGNLIWNTHYNRAEKLTIDGYTNIFNGVPNSFSLKAIILTPGWCENLGGKYVTEQHERTSYYFKGPNASFVLYFYGSIAYVMIDKAKIEVRTVHNLQNMVYFITGRELYYQPPDSYKPQG